MFASCAWFFEDLDRIEPRNAIGYGLRALRQAEKVHRVDLLTAYASDLRSAKSWRTGRTGLELLRSLATPARRSEERDGRLPAFPLAGTRGVALRLSGVA